MKKKLLIFTMLNFFFSYTQTKTGCEEILSKEVIIEPNQKDSIEKFIKDFSLLKNCGLDDFDIDFFSKGPFLGALFVQVMTEKKTNDELTYQKILDKILEIKKSKEYEQNRVLLIQSFELLKRPADIKNWDEDKILFQKIQMPNELIDKLFDYLKVHSNPNKTYKDIFEDFSESKLMKKENENEDFFKNAGNVNFANLLKKSQELDKPLLLFFTGYSCENSRKMKENILKNHLILEKLKNEFYFVNLYVDDKKSLPENEYFESKISKKLIKTIGQKHSELQISKFNKNSQPYFVIIDKSGRIIKEQDYTNDELLFDEFLNTK
jgi:thioredoxin-related protein